MQACQIWTDQSDTFTSFVLLGSTFLNHGHGFSLLQVPAAGLLCHASFWCSKPLVLEDHSNTVNFKFVEGESINNAVFVVELHEKTSIGGRLARRVAFVTRGHKRAFVVLQAAELPILRSAETISSCRFPSMEEVSLSCWKTVRRLVSARKNTFLFLVLFLLLCQRCFASHVSSSWPGVTFFFLLKPSKLL
jgi:hypothetical protein